MLDVLMVKELGDVGNVVKFLALVESAVVKKTRNGKDYLTGNLRGGDAMVGFKIWGGGTLDAVMEGGELAGKVVSVRGRVDEYNGVRSVVVDALRVEEELGYSDVVQSRYDVESIEKKLLQVMKRELSEEGYEIFEVLWGSVGERYKVEFAGKTMHDATPGGLLGHSFKCLKHMVLLTRDYPAINDRVDSDLLLIGVFFHDIGKVKEYINGQMSEVGNLLMHDYLGAKELEVAEGLIKSTKGEEWWYRLVSVCMQHHGEYGSRPRTLEAYLVHLVDMFESRVTVVEERLLGIAVGETVRLEGMYLS